MPPSAQEKVFSGMLPMGEVYIFYSCPGPGVADLHSQEGAGKALFYM
jgi:hypothetical protein